MQRKTKMIGLLILILLTLALWLRKPLLYSNWDKDVRVLANVEFSADQTSFSLKGIRNWSYTREGPGVAM